MEIKGEIATFSTGKTRDVFAGVIGIHADGYAAHGYDGGFYDPGDPCYKDNDEIALTVAERIELADYMITQWQKFKTKAEEDE